MSIDMSTYFSGNSLADHGMNNSYRREPIYVTLHLYPSAHMDTIHQFGLYTGLSYTMEGFDMNRNMWA